MTHAPWFKFYGADYLSSPFVQSLEPEQELWYVRLIIASAISEPRGCLPLSNDKLWRLAKAPSMEHFEKYAGPILAKFEKDQVAQLYRVPKVSEQTLVANADLSSKRSEAGRRGAAKRWQAATRGDGNLPSKPMANKQQEITDADTDKNLPPNPPPGGLTPRQLKDLSKEMDRLAQACVGRGTTEEKLLQAACAKLMLPLDLARKAMARSYGEAS